MRLTDWLTNLKEQTPCWGATRSAGGNETSRKLRSRHVPTLSHIDPIHVLPPCFLNIHFNITLLSTPVFPKIVAYLHGSTPNICSHFCSPPHVPHAPQISSPCIDHPIILAEQYILWTALLLIMCLFPVSVACCLWCPDIFHCTVFSNAFVP